VLLEIGPRHGRYALRYWLTDPGPDDPTDSQVRAHMLAALRRHAMKLGAPYQEQFDIRDDDAHRAAEREADRARRISALERVELFGSLSEAERETLARHLVYAPFVAGDVMTRQGAVAHWLYLIIEGEADVWFESGSARERVTTLQGGSIFGEMGMMTGAARTATVTARTDVLCYRLDKAGFAEIIQARPDVAEAMSKVLAKRQAELQGHRAAAPSAHAREHDDILARIRSFFGLEDEREDSRVTPR
jgi:CRP-like cAMP-binding protein